MKNHSYSETFSFTQDQVNSFAEITGDKNPIHLDEKYAIDTVFKKPIVHGMLTAGIISKLLGTKYPGEGTIYLYQEMKFLKPVYVNQNYRCVIETVEIQYEKKRAILSTTIYEGDELVLTGKALVQNERMFCASTN